MSTHLERSKSEYNFAKANYESFGDDPLYFLQHAFWLSQAVEMAIRFLFDEAGADQPGTHDVDQLIRIAHEQNIDLFLPRYIEGHAEMFTIWSERKDDTQYEIEQKKIDRAFDGVDEYFAFIDLGLRYGRVFTSDLRHEKAARAAVEAIKNSDFRVNVKSVFLFGSCARGTQGEWSDVDIGIITRSGLLDNEQIKEEYFNLISEMQSKDWDSADVEPHIFYDGEWENRKSNEYIKRDLKTIWENPDFV